MRFIWSYFRPSGMRLFLALFVSRVLLSVFAVALLLLIFYVGVSVPPCPNLVQACTNWLGIFCLFG